MQINWIIRAFWIHPNEKACLFSFVWCVCNSIWKVGLSKIWRVNISLMMCPSQWCTYMERIYEWGTWHHLLRLCGSGGNVIFLSDHFDTAVQREEIPQTQESSHCWSRSMGEKGDLVVQWLDLAIRHKIMSLGIHTTSWVTTSLALSYSWVLHFKVKKGIIRGCTILFSLAKNI